MTFATRAADWIAFAERHPNRSLLALVALGVLLRIVIVASAENRLDADESTVAVMALDILDGRGVPAFFYGQAYNGGATIEAMLAAPVFAVFGPSAIALKGVMIGFWTATAAVFAALARRCLPPRTAFLSLLFFSIGTPFFVEWSVKARGGYAETLLLSAVLLLVAAPAQGARRRALWFGLLAGLGVYASEMVIALVVISALWLWMGSDRRERASAVTATAAGFVVGSLPLFLWNATHGWQNYASSALIDLFGDRGGEPLSAGLLDVTRSFVLGPASAWLAVGLVVGTVRIARARPLGLAHVCSLHLVLFVSAYVLSGTRFLPEVAPARALYVTAIATSITLASAVAWGRGASALRAWGATLAILLWLVPTAVSLVDWAASGQPRESGSWRGSWALVDGEALRHELVAAGADRVVVSWWTAWPLRFADRVARRDDPSLPALDVRISTRALPDGDVAFALLAQTPLARNVDALVASETQAKRRRVGAYVVTTGVDAARVRDATALPDSFDRGAFPAPPAAPDGFN